MRKVPLPDRARLSLYTGALIATITGVASNAANLVVTGANTLTAKALVVIWNGPLKPRTQSPT